MQYLVFQGVMKKPVLKRKKKNYTETIQQMTLDTVGFPDITNFFELTHLKSLYELRDNPNLICYWYTKNKMTSK